MIWFLNQVRRADHRHLTFWYNWKFWLLNSNDGSQNSYLQIKGENGDYNSIAPGSEADDNPHSRTTWWCQWRSQMGVLRQWPPVQTTILPACFFVFVLLYRQSHPLDERLLALHAWTVQTGLRQLPPLSHPVDCFNTRFTSVSLSRRTVIGIGALVVQTVASSHFWNSSCFCFWLCWISI